MSAQKPERLRGGSIVVAADELARLGATGAGEFVVVGTGFASVAMVDREGQGAERAEVT